MLERLIGKTSGPTPSRAAPSRKQKPRKGDRDRQREPTSKNLPPRKAKSHPRRSARLRQSRASPIQPQDAPQPKPNLEPEQGRISASGKCPNREARVKEEHGSHPKDPAPLEDVLCTSSDSSDDLRVRRLQSVSRHKSMSFVMIGETKCRRSPGYDFEVPAEKAETPCRG